jgi:hypothetical protein
LPSSYDSEPTSAVPSGWSALLANHDARSDHWKMKTGLIRDLVEPETQKLGVQYFPFFSIVLAF